MIPCMPSRHLNRAVCIVHWALFSKQAMHRTKVASVFQSCHPFKKQGRGSVFSTHSGSVLILFYVVHTCCWLAACWWAGAHAAQRNPNNWGAGQKLLSRNKAWPGSSVQEKQTPKIFPLRRSQDGHTRINATRPSLLRPHWRMYIPQPFMSFGKINANIFKKKKKSF